MRRRLYFLLPDSGSARAMLNELLLARIEISHIRFMARHPLPADMPGLGLLQKTDLLHGAQLGFIMGSLAGLGAGVFLTLFPIDGFHPGTPTLLLLMLGGALFGSWASGMNAAAVPCKRLGRFARQLEQGQVLLLLDLPAARIAEIETLIAQRQPASQFGGIEPPVLAFP